jgi:quinoprotein relay system zinc metallohydrolase 1
VSVLSETEFADLSPDRRRVLKLTAAGIVSSLLPVFVAEAAPLAYVLKPIVIGDGAWMIAGVPEKITFENGGAIANITILDSSDGAIVIDTGPSRRFGEDLAKVARDLTGKDIARVYVTHFHPDHVFGNQGFDAAKIAAPDGVIKGLQDLGNGFSDAMYYIARDWMRGTEVVLPTKAVTAGIEQIGERKLHLMPLAGHTASDLAIYDETSGLLITGDLAFLDRAPTTPHADLATWRTTLEGLSQIQANMIVPGHGPAERGQRSLKQTRDWLDGIEAVITSSFERGLDMTEAMQHPLPPSLESIALARYEFERSVMHLYPKLEAARLPSVGKRSE